MVSSGGTLELIGGAALIGTTVFANGATLLVGSGYTQTGTVSAGVTVGVLSGGIASAIVLSGGELEIQSGGTAVLNTIGFSNAGGILKLDQSSVFSATISGFGVPGDIDLADINFSAATLSYSSTTSSSGILTVTDGIHSANLNMLGSYVTANFNMANDGSGGVLVTDPYLDGAANAPAGAPALPSLLSGFAVRPPWQVANVDYHVGVPTGTVLKDPTVSDNLPAGATYNATSHAVIVTGSNVVLNGFDFSVSGGIQIFGSSSALSNTTIENSYFAFSTNSNTAGMIQFYNGNLTLLNDTFNGTGSKVAAGVFYNGSGILTAQYDSFDQMWADAIDMNSSTVTPIIEYNYFGVIGNDPTSHPDPVQWVKNTVNNGVIAFNTIYSPQSGQNHQGTEQLSFHAQLGSTFTNTIVENNVIISTAGGNPTVPFLVLVYAESGNTINGMLLESNYVAPQGGNNVFYPTPSAGTLTNQSFVNTVNMLTGTQVAGPSGASSNVFNVVASPPSGTENPAIRSSSPST